MPAPPSMRPQRRPDGRIVGVLGASGGVGASTLTAASAVASAAAGLSVTVIETDPHSGGIDVLFGLENEPGARWPELCWSGVHAASGAVAARLPHRRGCAVLSWGRDPRGGHECGADVMVSVAGALSTETDVTIIDLPTAGMSGASAWWSLCDDLVIVVGGSSRQVMAACVVLETVVADVPAMPGVAAVVRHCGVRQGGSDREEVSEAVGVPVIGTLRDDRGIAAALARGLPVVDVRGPLHELAEDLVAATVTARRPVA